MERCVRLPGGLASTRTPPCRRSKATCGGAAANRRRPRVGGARPTAASGSRWRMRHQRRVPVLRPRAGPGATPPTSIWCASSRSGARPTSTPARAARPHADLGDDLLDAPDSPSRATTSASPSCRRRCAKVKAMNAAERASDRGRTAPRTLTDNVAIALKASATFAKGVRAAARPPTCDLGAHQI